MIGDRRDPIRTGGDDLSHVRFGIGPLTLAHDGADAVAGQTAGDEYDVAALHPRDAGSAEGE
jgi:hypothetical protein